MKITALSLNIEWENKEANFAKVESLLSQLDEAGDVVILPEMLIVTVMELLLMGRVFVLLIMPVLIVKQEFVAVMEK